MSFEFAIYDLPRQATSVIPQYSAVVHDTANVGRVILPGGTDAARFAGFAQIATTLTTVESIPVRVLGVSRAIAAAATNLGDLISTNGTAGKVGTATPAGGTSVAGWGLEAATANNDIFAVLVVPNQR